MNPIAEHLLNNVDPWIRMKRRRAIKIHTNVTDTVARLGRVKARMALLIAVSVVRAR